MSYSLEEIKIPKEEGSTLPLYHSCGKLQKHDVGENVETQPTPTLRIINKQSGENNKKKKEGIHHVRNPLLFIVARKESIVLLVIGNQMYIHFVERRAIMWHLTGRRNPHDPSQKKIRGGMVRRIP